MPSLSCLTIFEAGSFGSSSGNVVVPSSEVPFPITAYTIGEATGTSTAVAEGDSILNSSTGLAEGTSTAFAVGEGLVATVGSAAGVGAAPGVGSFTTINVGTAAGIGDAPAVGSSIVSTVGSAAGVGNALGISSGAGRQAMSEDGYLTLGGARSATTDNAFVIGA